MFVDPKQYYSKTSRGEEKMKSAENKVTAAITTTTMKARVTTTIKSDHTNSSRSVTKHRQAITTHGFLSRSPVSGQLFYVKEGIREVKVILS